ncbi:DNA photolyase family protein [Gracilibacillus caseinilyticus]|uniref:DNA photolyase family protein n=1 Tax=Gracilibacillus caseinilyticus TaxID=2932256 RepID=A0ABY4F1B1_9BACI|nr:deoxyribodipyrimidine photo-lyase [Gracilibacillus caseinilyticus]UOQ49985.1 DNA photolyase family protein [Gracilibacillus caseinilyticus]
MSKTIIVWFRDDLRILDHPALYHAALDGKVIPLYIHNETEHTNSEWYSLQALTAFQQQLRDKGATLVIKHGEPVRIIPEVVQTFEADAVYCHYQYGPGSREQDEQIKENLFVPVRQFHGNVLTEPGTILNKQKQPYKVFTSFWKSLRSLPIAKPFPVPHKVDWYNGKASAIPHAPKSPLNTYWQAGERQALNKWRQFLHDQINHYQEYRDFPGIDATSLLSGHLSHGEISPKLIWHEAKEALEITSMENRFQHTMEESTETFLKQLVWREFAYHQLTFFPQIIDKPLQPKFQAFQWQEPDPLLLDSWKKGLTGYPLVDAGMRELLETGYMHNRVRMVTGSFLVKHLLIHWLDGQAWFSRMLVDHDLANNTMGWQWVAGTGFDSSPFFRIFNPVKQAEKFDPDGTYMRNWLPELRNLPLEYLYHPWEAPEGVLQEAGITLGKDYPLPIVEHQYARERALEAFKQLKKEANNH